MDEDVRAELVRLAASGDADAFQRLILHYHPVLRALWAGRIGSRLRPHLDADDALQQAYVSAFKSIADAHFQTPAEFYCRLERVALNELRDMQRGLKRQKRDVGRNVGPAPTAGRPGECAPRAEVRASRLPDFIQHLPADDQTPSRQLARAELEAAVLSSLVCLTDPQRRVIRRRYFEHQPVAELATTEAAVHALCYRAIRELRRHLGSITHYLSRL